MKRYIAPKVLAMEFCWDINDIKENRYQAGKTDKPIYIIGNDYFCATKQNQKPAKHYGLNDFKWEKYNSSFADSIGWQIWICKSN